jgi:hypothetical protein
LLKNIFFLWVVNGPEGIIILPGHLNGQINPWRKAHGATRPVTTNQKGGEIMARIQRIVKYLVCIGLLTAFVGCASTQKRESTGQYVDDSVITAKVKAAIMHEESLKVLQIKVETYKGVVQLSGFVNSEQSVMKAGEVATGVEGVVSVKNDLVVK